MAKVKTSELIGVALDWAVAYAIGEYKPVAVPQYSTDWAQGGPIISELMLKKGLVLRAWAEKDICEASLDYPRRFSTGSTPLIAAMRCYVYSKVGEFVDIPDELLC